MRTLLLFPTASLAGLLIGAASLAAPPPAPESVPAVAPANAARGFSVVVHPSNPVSDLSLPGLREIFSGAVTHWPNQSKIVLAQRASGSLANQFLMDRFLKTSWQDYKRSLEEIAFKGQEPVVMRVLNSDAAACRFVFNVPAAVALIETSSAALPECHDVRIVKIDGRLPAEKGYRLR